MALFDNRGFGGFGQEQYRPESEPAVEQPVGPVVESVAEEPVSEPVAEQPVEPVAEQPVEPVVERTVEPKPAAKPKAKPKNKKRGPDAKSVNLTLAARGRLDEDVRRVLSGLTGHTDEADLVSDVLVLTGGKVDRKVMASVLDAAGMLDGDTRRVLVALTGHDDDARLVLDVLDKAAARPAALLLEAADAADDVSRAILLMQKGEKDNSALRAAARLAEAVNPDLAGRFATTNQPALVGALAQTVGLLDRSVLESLR
ncbi:hypothetical protein KZO96_09815 [Bifidobacterium pseudocatenulatum]|uniref:hypothetical protein n=1 Tax=Bifidobacterium pseudocatenulatum TaxID=28026 RepID=UPI001CFE3017|nr:hypothetical protein [Bifidobacterium pseudocatenulatum]MCB4888134.1 hypothetical protein [Bifidobacterium pseudocatenulatum]